MTLAEEIARLTIGSPGEPIETRGISAEPPPPDNRRFHELVQTAREKILGGPMSDRFWTGVPGMAEFEGVPSIRGPRWFDADYLAQQGLMMMGFGPNPKLDAQYYRNLIAKERAAQGMEAAIKDPVTGNVYTAYNHGEIPDLIKDIEARGRIAKLLKDPSTHGFRDSSGKFYTRDEMDAAFKIRYAEDIDPRLGPYHKGWMNREEVPAYEAFKESMAPPAAGPKIDQKMFAEMDTLIDEGINVEHQQIADMIEGYTYRNQKDALTKALRDPGYEAYANDLRLLLRRIYPDGKIPVARKTGYAGGTGEGAGKFVSVSTNPGWPGDKYLVSVDDVAFAGHQAEGELIVKKTGLKKGK